ncbi:MAG: hypothetical protein WA988_10395 [Candidatus Nanopelagicales bacterium]
MPIDDEIGDGVAGTERPYEAVELSIADAFLPPSPAIIDVGANIGNHAVYGARNHQAEVTAFERYTPARQLFGANITCNGVSRLATHG